MRYDRYRHCAVTVCWNLFTRVFVYFLITFVNRERLNSCYFLDSDPLWMKHVLDFLQSTFCENC